MPFNFTEDIDNRPDVVIWLQDIIDTSTNRVHGTVINSTKVTFIAPPNFVVDKTRVEISLNNQQYTDDNVWYYYYAPPEIYEVDPREGPTKGGTKVHVWGNKFDNNKNNLISIGKKDRELVVRLKRGKFRKDKKIECNFGEKSTIAKYISNSEIICTSPPVDEPGIVPLTISYEGEKCLICDKKVKRGGLPQHRQAKHGKTKEA